MIFLTGDTHSEVERLSSKNFPDGKILNRSDYVIVLGDFALVWDKVQSEREKYWISWLDNKPWTTLFLDGNHENFERLDQLPTKEMFGGEVGVLANNIYHLKRGDIYLLEGKKFFTFGGGQSIDKHLRIENISWWARELPNYAEYHKGLESLEKVSWNIDYVLTHDAPRSIYKAMAEKYFFHKTGEYDLPKFLEEVKNKAQYRHWYFAHFHYNDTFEQKFTCLYENVVMLDPGI